MLPLLLRIFAPLLKGTGGGIPGAIGTDTGSNAGTDDDTCVSL